MFCFSFSLNLVSVWITLLVTFPSFSLTRASSLLPFSMVKIRLLSGMVVRSHPASVVLPELVAPATQMLMPYRRHSARKSSISSVAVPPSTKSHFFRLCGFTIRMEAAIPTSSSTRGVFNTAIRMFLLRCPSTAGEALSSTMPDTWSILRITLMACSGDSKCSSSFSHLPSLYCTSMSFHELMSISSIPVPKMYFVKKENSAISVYRSSISCSLIFPFTLMR